MGEKLDWSSDCSVKEVMSRFKRATVWPHIAKQEREEMHFLFYLDYLRVFPYSFYIKDPGAGTGVGECAVADDVKGATESNNEQEENEDD
jgi:hypothetical protein